MGCRNRDLCIDLFKKLNILALQSQYMLWLLLLLIYNKHQFNLNLYVYNKNTRRKYNSHLPASNLSLYKKRVYFTDIKVLSNLPQSMQNLEQ
jgi:hypothetical protein